MGKEYEWQLDAYQVAVFHCMKYSAESVNGVLLGKPNDGGGATFVRAVSYITL